MIVEWSDHEWGNVKRNGKLLQFVYASHEIVAMVASRSNHDKSRIEIVRVSYSLLTVKGTGIPLLPPSP